MLIHNALVIKVIKKIKRIKEESIVTVILLYLP